MAVQLLEVMDRGSTSVAGWLLCMQHDWNIARSVPAGDICYLTPLSPQTFPVCFLAITMSNKGQNASKKPHKKEISVCWSVLATKLLLLI